MKKKTINQIILFFKGLLMWACDIVPWVSWWTIAFITWIYDELIDSLYELNLQNLKLLLQLKFKKVRKNINWNFLLIVFSWIITSILSLSHLISFLLKNYTNFVMAFFMWLIIASTFILHKKIKSFKYYYLIFLFIWLCFGYIITILSNLYVWNWYFAFFISGFFAIIAMILPWISWSYILVIIWQYQNILDKINEITSWHIDWVFFVTMFILWAIFGLISFSKLLHYIKNKFHDIMIITLVGVMIWSLNSIRPRTLNWEKILPIVNKENIIIFWFTILWIFVILSTYFLWKNIKKLNKKNI